MERINNTGFISYSAGETTVVFDVAKSGHTRPLTDSEGRIIRKKVNIKQVRVLNPQSTIANVEIICKMIKGNTTITKILHKLKAFPNQLNYSSAKYAICIGEDENNYAQIIVKTDQAVDVDIEWKEEI